MLIKCLINGDTPEDSRLIENVHLISSFNGELISET